tara:strand:- start:131 stop:406 length:276 start_codon:yes stop_codon:yes gene_type:complete
MKKRKGLTKINIDGMTDMYQLYNTVILSTNGSFIKLNTSGFKTNHTKNCMNDNLPSGYKVYQKDFEWYVDTPSNKGLTFEDDMILTIEKAA